MNEEQENEKKLIEERTFAALKLQRKQRLESLIEKRKNNLSYLIIVHLGETYWLNSILLNRKEITLLLEDKVQGVRGLMFYYLGLSLSLLLNKVNGYEVISSFLQLFEEWEYYFSSIPMQGMKYVLARNSSLYYPSLLANNNNNNNNNNEINDREYQIRNIGLYKYNNEIIFEFLQTPEIPFELNYIEVFINLCQMLISLYEKFWHEDSFT